TSASASRCALLTSRFITALNACGSVGSPGHAMSSISLPSCRTSKRWRSGSSGRHQNESLRWRRRRGGGIHFNADAHHETAIIKDRIERNDDKIEAFFDSIDPSRTWSVHRRACEVALDFGYPSYVK